ADPDRLREALDHVTRGLQRAEEEDEYLEALALKAGIEIELGRKDAARRTLAELPPVHAAFLSPPLAMELAHLFLEIPDDDEAARRFQSLTEREPELADAWYGLGLAAEEQGDEDGKRQAWLRTLELDEAMEIEGERLGEQAVAEVAEAALGELPPRAQA